MPDLFSFPFTAMGTDCVLHLHAERARAEEAADAAMAEVFRIEAKYSRYRRDSLLSHINEIAAIGGSTEVDEETAALLDYACAGHRKSGGLFDITSGILRRAWDFSSPRLPDPAEIMALLPLVGLEKVQWSRPRLAFPVPGMELDFGGIGKEYAVDRAAEVCAAAGIDSGLIDLGGDIRALGPHPGGDPWLVQIRNPRAPERALATVRIARGALASSGDYERYIEIAGTRYCHILDPRTGWPASGLASVSVMADQCLVAGTLTTVAMLKGADGPAWLNAMKLRHLWVDLQGRQGGDLAADLTPCR